MSKEKKKRLWCTRCIEFPATTPDRCCRRCGEQAVPMLVSRIAESIRDSLKFELVEHARLEVGRRSLQNSFAIEDLVERGFDALEKRLKDGTYSRRPRDWLREFVSREVDLVELRDEAHRSRIHRLDGSYPRPICVTDFRRGVSADFELLLEEAEREICAAFSVALREADRSKKRSTPWKWVAVAGLLGIAFAASPNEVMSLPAGAFSIPRFSDSGDEVEKKQRAELQTAMLFIRGEAFAELQTRNPEAAEALLLSQIRTNPNWRKLISR